MMNYVKNNYMMSELDATIYMVMITKLSDKLILDKKVLG